MPRPSTLSTTTPICAGDAPPQQPALLREQILRLKAKALELAAVCDDNFREPQLRSVTAQPEAVDEVDNMLLPPPPQHHLRLKRRLPVREPAYECGATQRCVSARYNPIHDNSAVNSAEAGSDDENEFVGPDGCFKLPRLLHPVLERHNATAGIKREHEPLAQSPRATAFARPRRVLPCVTARAVALRLVQ